MVLVSRGWTFFQTHHRLRKGLWEVLLETGAVSVIIVAVLFFFRENISHNTVYYANDTKILYYPVMASLAEARRSGELTLWSPSHLHGFPFFADGEAGALYPVNYVLLSHMPIEQAFVWLMVIRVGLASVFMYAYARSIGLARIAEEWLGWSRRLSNGVAALIALAPVLLGLRAVYAVIA